MPDLHFSRGKAANAETAAFVKEPTRVYTSRVDANISDLFFNTDHGAATYERHGGKLRFTGYDETKLRTVAGDTLGCLERLGVAVPTVDELIADFYLRI